MRLLKTAILILVPLILGAQCKPGPDPLSGLPLVACASAAPATISASAAPAILATINTGSSTCTPSGGVGTETCTASPTCGTSSGACAVITHGYGSGTKAPWVTCNDSSGNEMGGLSASVSVTDIVATSTNSVTITFSAATGAGAQCRISNAQSGSTGATGASGNNIRKCVVIVGDPGAASSVLANDNDSPAACSNDFGADWTITTVAAYVDAGTPTVDVIFFGGASILTGAITGSAGTWVAGTLSGTPVVHTFSGAGATCSSTPCALSPQITTASTAKYIIWKIVGTIP